MMQEGKLEKIITEYDTELRYFAFKYVKDWNVVEDILQEVYLKVFLKMDSFQGKASMKTWIYKITRNQCIDYLRSRSYQSTVLTECPEEIIESEQLAYDKEGVERKLMKKQEQEKLRRKLNTLPEDYQKPISLYYFYDYSYKEISQMLNKDISYVKNRLFRGKRLLKLAFEVS